VEMRMEARKTVKQSSWSSVAKLMGGFSRKGAKLIGLMTN